MMMMVHSREQSFSEMTKDATLLSLGQGFGRLPFRSRLKLWR
jgi:hypothetical protein